MATSDSSRAGFLPARVIHLHPSRFCNLACQHCYSASGPHVRGELAPDAIIDALVSLRREGYEVLSLSGGEPLLYSGFEQVVQAAVALGFKITLITNGTPLGGQGGEQLLNVIAQSVNLIAVSLDGAPETHVQMRGHRHAFTRAERAIDRLAAVGVKVGIAYCLSQKSLADMPWAVEFAEKKGASLVQFHPFAATGRGQQLATSLSLNETEKTRAYVIAALLETDKGPAIQLDLAPVEALRARRSDYALLVDNAAGFSSLSNLVNPLIIDELGRMLPLCYGIHPGYSLGQIGPNMGSLIANYKLAGWRDLYTLLNASFTQLGTHGEQFVDWFYHIVETSYQPWPSPFAAAE